ncbi:class I SAM-dependent methyltransferase [Pseudomonas sp. GD04087]|uniref:class I SAM-dependent methyltransferase n=1 Tax=Pseudomonas TaxID=286 RepID=UPI001F396A91|nr:MULTISPECIES: class I SAM-dependent methyltransferase [Pseudomonas]MCP1649026.1 ubiquinone/menaquinone biosynthesis C-methylase UbiE [Pseudomonas nitroreducens]MCP1685013.1 ubiquinone/menaquinone biosynthesis C-methylase UbiE [Pseudomonas nitroreducens]MDH0287929.1 class I SAM-dependent methyltransferase [Pseudomonas sp. GD04087]MDH1050281.1 class I SAM-dependent methyltransferase [Pseudomonas sp. GD03903]MDH1998809.1 class I SAM-dependent methyltransferase [Pseudomonas sp. GD03691]
MTDKPVDLEFSQKYDRQHAERYLRKHQAGLSRKLSHWRDVQVARQALKLAGQPNLVLDLPCGAGRFWPMLAEKENRVIIGADNSPDMIAVACAGQPNEVVKRVRPLQTSAFAIDLPDNAVDSIFSMRLMHHIGESDDRLTMLREFHRVTRDSVILSMWVDGNFKSWKRARAESTRQKHAYQNRFVIPAKTIEAEFRQAGFKVQDHIDFVPLIHMWRVYILRKE